MYKKLFALSITSTLSISSLIGTGIVLLNQNNNKNLVTHYNYNTSSKNVLSIDEAEENGITIRTNPINGFDSLDVRDGSGNKLVLTTVKLSGEIDKTYGVALVNFESNEMLDHWEIPTKFSKFTKNNEISNEPYVTNYTTNIIPGNDANEFFVLAGISNLADALNSVYNNELNSKKGIPFHDIVSGDAVNSNIQKKAPSIKIFKIKITKENSLVGVDSDQKENDMWFDFKYPADPVFMKQDYGLKFFTRSGLFATYYIQQYPINSDSTSFGFGYLQYLQYGQLFQYNYKNKTEPEFALINSWLSNDVSMGNLYAFYSSETRSLAPTISMYKYFHAEVLRPMKDKDEATKYTEYQIITAESNNESAPAPESDQLTRNTALSLLFMYNTFALDKKVHKGSYLNFPTKGTDLWYDGKFDGHGQYYGFVPGWFLFKPSSKPTEVSLKYGYLELGEGQIGKDIWYTAIGSYYENNEFYLTIAHNKAHQWPITSIIILNVDLFGSYERSYHFVRDRYGGFFCDRGTKIYPSNENILFNQRYNKDSDSGVSSNPIGGAGSTKPMFMRFYDGDKDVNTKYKKNIVTITTNATNEVIIFTYTKNKDNIISGNEIIFDKDEYEPIQGLQSYSSVELKDDNIWLNLQYNKYTNTLIAINDNAIFSYLIKDNDSSEIRAHRYIDDSNKKNYLIKFVSTHNVTSGEGFDTTGSGNKFIKAFQLSVNNKWAFFVEIIEFVGIEKLNSLLGIINSADVGFQQTRSYDELDRTTKALNFDELTELKPKDIQARFVKDLNRREPGIIDSVKSKGLIIKDYDSKTKNFIVSELINIDNDIDLIGFTSQFSDWTIKKGNSKYDVTKFGDFKLANFVFNDLINVKEKNPYKNWSVVEIETKFKNNDEKVNRDLFDTIVDTEKTEYGTGRVREDYELGIKSSNVNANEIVFGIYYIDDNGNKKEVLNEGKGGDNQPFTYRASGIFKVKMSSTTIMWIIIGITLGVAIALGLGLGIGIPMRKNAKLSHQKMDTLTAAIGNVFKKMSDIINVKKKTPMLLRDKKQTPSTLKPRSPINSNSKPIPKKPINSVEPKKPIDTSQKSN